MTVDLTRWKQIGRQRLTAEETKAYIAGNSPASVKRSFDHVVVTEIKKNPLRAIQTIYERIPENGQQTPAIQATMQIGRRGSSRKGFRVCLPKHDQRPNC